MPDVVFTDWTDVSWDDTDVSFERPASSSASFNLRLCTFIKATAVKVMVFADARKLITYDNALRGLTKGNAYTVLNTGK